MHGNSWDGGAVTVKVGKPWPNGTQLRDAYSGQTAVVKGGKVTMTPAADRQGILLLETGEEPGPGGIQLGQRHCILHAH